ncbi:hypothetical protein WA158_007427 [Blastocystis sp. Blastoise]
MSESFWSSSQYKEWTSKLTPEIIKQEHNKNNNLFDEKETEAIFCHCINLLFGIGKRNSYPHTVICTSIIYFQRAYLKLSFTQLHPYLAIPTVLYLSSKTEEVIPMIKKILNNYITELKYRHLPLLQWTSDDINQAECLLLNIFNFDIIIHHPFQTLDFYVEEMHLKEYTQVSWTILNDIYYTSLPLLYPPYMLALTAIYMTSIYSQADILQCLTDMDIDIQDIFEITAEIVKFYKNNSVLVDYDSQFADLILRIDIHLEKK